MNDWKQKLYEHMDRSVPSLDKFERASIVQKVGSILTAQSRHDNGVYKKATHLVIERFNRERDRVAKEERERTLHEILSKAESMTTAREVRHYIKDQLLDPEENEDYEMDCQPICRKCGKPLQHAKENGEELEFIYECPCTPGVKISIG